MRFAARAFSGSLFHEPPRSTGGQAFEGGIKPPATEEGLAQVLRIGMARVGDPGLDMQADGRFILFAVFPARAQRLQPAMEAVDVVGRQGGAHPATVQDVTQKLRGFRSCRDEGFARVQQQASLCEVVGHLRLPAHKRGPVVGKQGKVAHVTQVRRAHEIT